MEDSTKGKNFVKEQQPKLKVPWHSTQHWQIIICLQYISDWKERVVKADLGSGRGADSDDLHSLEQKKNTYTIKNQALSLPSGRRND